MINRVQKPGVLPQTYHPSTRDAEVVEFEASLGYEIRLCVKNKNTERERENMGKGRLIFLLLLLLLVLLLFIM